MAIVVNTNLTALKTQKNLTSATTSMNKALNRMSTGYKINNAADDAAGLYVATGIETQIRGSKVAQDNIATGKNVLQTAEGDLNTILDHLNRIRDLAVQAGNSIYDTDGYAAIEKEVEARWDEIDRVARASNFNGLKLLSDTGSLTEIRLQVGANASITENCIKVANVFGDATASSTAGLNIKDTSAFDSATNAAAYIDTIDEAINKISTRMSTIGAMVNRLDSAEASLTTTIENATAAKSTIMDADIAAESMEYTKAQILQQTSAALLVQANALPQIAISLVQG